MSSYPMRQVAASDTIDVADVSQDVFVAALSRIAELRDPAAFGGWLATMARHASVDAMRRHRPTAVVTEADDGAPTAA